MQNQCFSEYKDLLEVLEKLMPANETECERVLTVDLINKGNCYLEDIYKSYGYPDKFALTGICKCLDKLSARGLEAKTILDNCAPQTTEIDGCGNSCTLVCIHIFIFNPPLYQTNIIFRFYISISARILNASTTPFS